MKFIYRTLEPHSQELQYGAEEKVTDTSKADLGLHDVLVKVKACCICKLDKRVLFDLFQKRAQVQFPSCLEVCGSVHDVGQDVTTVKKGDIVAGLIRLDSEEAGCSELCILSEYETAKLPPGSLDPVAAVGCLRPGLRAYTALHTLAHLGQGETVLITNGASDFGILATQLAQLWGAKIISSVNTPEEANVIQRFLRPVDHVINVSANRNVLLSSVREETGGLGVDVIIDSGVRLFENEANDSDEIGVPIGPAYLPSKQELISCLAVGGRWVTSHSELQLDPPNCQQLFYRGASVSFLFDQTWTLASSRQGILLHILRDLLNKASNGQLGPIEIDHLKFSAVTAQPALLESRNPRHQTVIEMT